MLSSIPTLDLHGEYADSARILTEEFINDNVILHNYQFYIVHGKGQDILRKVVHEVLKKDKRVKEYKLNYLNDGCTVVKLKENV